MIRCALSTWPELACWSADHAGLLTAGAAVLPFVAIVVIWLRDLRG